MENFLDEHADQLIVLTGVVTFLVVAGFVIARHLMYKHTERLALIEKGLDLPVSEANLGKNITLRAVLKLGILFCGVGFGVLAGFIVQQVIPSFDAPLPYMFAIPFFTGISLIIFYLVNKE